MLGKRRGHGTHELNYRPHNVTHIVIGTVFLWVGWFGFNAGSALSANLRAIMAAMVTNLAACVGGITWCLVDVSVVPLQATWMLTLSAVSSGEEVVHRWLLLRGRRRLSRNHTGLRLRSSLGRSSLRRLCRSILQLCHSAKVLAPSRRRP